MPKAAHRNRALDDPAGKADGVQAFDPELWSIVWLSLQTSGTALLISSLIGIPLGAWLGQARFRGRRLVAALIHTGMAMPPVVVGLVVYLLLSRSGPLADLDWLFTPQAMILAQTILTLPWIVGIITSAVAAMPAELHLQVRSLGASRWQARWTILREARQGVLLAVAAAFGRSISEVGAVMMVGGNVQGQTRVMTTAIVLETSKGQFGLALALGAWLLALALVANLVIVRAQGKPGT
jgi:tungstate transport system permease protein